MSRRTLTNRNDRAVGHYQHRYGHRGLSSYGDGELLAPWAEGDVVDIPADNPAFGTSHLGGGPRIPHSYSKHPELSKPGLYRVVTAFSIGEDDEWYFRVCPIIDGETVWDEGSDRLHVIAGVCDYTADWVCIESADPRRVSVGESLKEPDA